MLSKWYVLVHFLLNIAFKKNMSWFKEPWTTKLKTQTEQNVFIETNTTI